MPFGMNLERIVVGADALAGEKTFAGCVANTVFSDAAGATAAGLRLPTNAEEGEEREEVPPPPPLTAEEASQTLSYHSFETALIRLFDLVIDGEPGVLHAVRSLRNKELKATKGDQSKASARVQKRLGGGGKDDMRQFALGCLPGVGLPLALVQPLWLRFRRTALICELCGQCAHTPLVPPRHPLPRTTHAPVRCASPV
jgi:hypothetical protein